MTYLGNCQCGNVSISFETNKDPESLELRSCQCSFCRSYHSVTAADPAGSVKITIKSSKAVKKVQFALQTADYLVCDCGDYVGAVLEKDKARYSTINMRLFAGFSNALRNAVPVSYEDESQSDRIKRRVATWTPTEMFAK